MQPTAPTLLLALTLAATNLQAQTTHGSASYRSECTIVAPGIDHASSASYSTFAVVGATVSGSAASASYETEIGPLCPELSGGCGVVLCGDCNGDGAVTILDALAAAQSAVGTRTLTPMQFASCDVDMDGDVDILDALLIAQVSAGLPVMLTCC